MPMTGVDGTMRSKRVILYALSVDVWSRRTKEWLDQNSVVYEYCDIVSATGQEQKRIRAEVKRLNPKGTFPTIVIGDEVVVGFDPDRITRLLGQDEARDAAEKARQEVQRRAEEELRHAHALEEQRRRTTEEVGTLNTKLDSLVVESAGLEQKFAYAEISAAEYTARKNRIAQEIESAKNRLAELEGKPTDVAVATPSIASAAVPPAPDDNPRLIKQRFLDGEIDRAEYESLIALNKASSEATAKPSDGPPDDMIKEFENLLKSGAISEEKFKELKAKYEASRKS
jgi:glutaredoxin